MKQGQGQGQGHGHQLCAWTNAYSIGIPELIRHRQSHAQFVAKIVEKKTVLIHGGTLQLDLLHYLRDRNLRGKPRGSARGLSEQAGTACCFLSSMAYHSQREYRH